MNWIIAWKLLKGKVLEVSKGKEKKKKDRIILSLWNKIDYPEKDQD